MEYRKIGDSTLEVSAITFGAWAIGGWMWGGSSRKEALKAIRAGFDAGITSIDTAPVYGMGLSEELVAEAMEGVGREKMQLLTKFGLQWVSKKGKLHVRTVDNSGRAIEVNRYASKEQVIKECEECLKRLKTDYIDLFQLHWPDPTTPIAETMEALVQLKKEGKIREAGVCNFDVAQLEEALEIMPLVSNQIPYSMLKRTAEQELLPFCREKKLGILAYSPLQRGLLTGKIQPNHTFELGDSRVSSPYYRADNVRLVNAFLEKIKPMAEEKGATLAQLVIQWTIQQPGITVALVGARNADQAQQNAEAANISLNQEELKQLSESLKTLELDLS